MYSFQVKKRDYLKISMILGIICIGGMFISLYLYDEIVNKFIRWVNKQESIKKTFSFGIFHGKFFYSKYVLERTFLRIFFPKQTIFHLFTINPSLFKAMANSKIIISQNVFGTTISTGFQCIHFQHTQSRGSSKWRKTTFGRNWALCFSVSKNKQFG